MRYLLTTIAFILTLGGAAQDFIGFKGVVKDSLNEPLPYATIAALDPVDSTMIGFGITDDDGKFIVELEDTGTYLFKIVLVGYSTYNDKVTLTKSNPIKDYGEIPLSDELLRSLDITAEHIPVLIKEDTIEYNADAFKTDANAPLEDLLKKLPGVEVGQDGSIKAQGEDVTKIYVDGKEFFGDDPKVASKNLPADAIKKVQVYDKKSETSDFTGVDDGTTSKTINIELKDDKKKGTFGKMTAGYGMPDDRFKFKGNVNKFNKKFQFSLIGMANNTNEDGFSWGDYMDFMGGAKAFGGGGGFRFNSDDIGLNIGNGLANGMVSSASGGANMNYQFSKKSRLNLSYFVYQAKKDLIQTEFTNNILDTTTYTTNDDAIENSLQWSHTMNMRFDQEIDSLREFRISGSGSYNTNTFDGTYVNSTIGEEGDSINSGNNATGYDGFNYSADVDLVYRNKFKKKGRNFVIEGSAGIDNSDYSGYLNNVSKFFNGGIPTTTVLDQKAYDDGANQWWDGEIAYTEPLGGSKFLKLSVEHGEDLDRSKYEAYDYVDFPSYDETFNMQLSSDYRRGYNYTTAGAALRWIKDKWNLNPGVETQWIQLSGDDYLLDTVISENYFNILPFITIKFTPKQTARWRFNYKTELNAPSIGQLQNKVDNSDPFNVVEGNPELNPEYVHQIRLNGGSFSQFTMSGFYGGLNGNITKDKIQYATTITPQFVRISRPINVDNDYSASFYGGFYSPIKKLKIKMNLNAYGGFSKGYFEINDVQSSNEGKNGSVSVTFENSKKKIVDISVGGTFSGTITTYDNSSYQDQVFNTISGFIDFKWNIKENWIFRTSYDHTQYQSKAFGDATVIPLLKASVSRYLLDKRAEFKIEAFDILDQNKGVSRSSNLNYLTETRTNSIGRYFMASFTYSLAKMGGEKNKWMMTGRH